MKDSTGAVDHADLGDTWDKLGCQRGNFKHPKPQPSPRTPTQMFSKMSCQTFTNSAQQQVGDTFIRSPTTAQTLDSVTKRLHEENKDECDYRRALHFAMFPEKELIPILRGSGDDLTVFLAVVRLLANLTIPTECLFPASPLKSNSRSVIYEINSYLGMTKEAFRDRRTTQTLLNVLSLKSREESLSQVDTELVMTALLLIRNLLHIPQQSSKVQARPSIQSQIIWNLFSQDMDKILLRLISHKNRHSWCTCLVQIIALIYKDQHVVMLQNHLQDFLDSSDSSEDDESNTCYQESSFLYPQVVSCLDTGVETATNDDHSDDGGSVGNAWVTTVMTQPNQNLSVSLESPTRTPGPSSSTVVKSALSSSPAILVASSPTPAPFVQAAEAELSQTPTGKMEEVSPVSTALSSPIQADNEEDDDNEDIDDGFVPEEENMFNMFGCSSSVDWEPPTKKLVVECKTGDLKIVNKPSMSQKLDEGKLKHKLTRRNAAQRKKVKVSDINPMNNEKKTEGGGDSSRIAMGGQSRKLEGSKHKKVTTFINKPRNLPLHKTGRHSLERMGVGGNGSDSSSTTGIPKKLLNPNSNNSGNTTDYGYVSQQTTHSQQEGRTKPGEEGGAIWGSSGNCTTSSTEEDFLGKQFAKLLTKPNRVRQRSSRLLPLKDSLLSPQQKQEQHRYKLLRRTQELRARSKFRSDLQPTEKDITELLKEFTIEFIFTGYVQLVETVLTKLSECESSPTLLPSMDRTHFLWLLTYFLKFTGQLKFGFEQLESVLSYNTIAFLAYEGVELLEQVELAASSQKQPLSNHTRRMHLLVTTLKEVIHALLTYSQAILLVTKTSHSTACNSNIIKLFNQIRQVKEVRQLMLILLRRYNPQYHTTQYLSDLITCNHTLLQVLDMSETLDEEPQQQPAAQYSLIHHLEQFANTEVMRQYGLLLQQFDTNSHTVNDFILTMMHHVAGDLKSPQSLFIPSVLKSISRIWEGKLTNFPDWTDLIEYIIQTFIQSMGRTPLTCASNLVDCLNTTETLQVDTGLTPTQSAQLCGIFSQVVNSSDPIESIIEIFRQTDNAIPSRLSVIQALFSNGVITHAQYLSFMYMKSVMATGTEDAEHEDSVVAEVGSVVGQGGQQAVLPEEHLMTTDAETDSDTVENKAEAEINLLKDLIRKQGQESLLTWVQAVVLELCRVKIYPTQLVPRGLPHEPVPFFSNLARHSVPLVPYNRTQSQGLQTESFILLLHKLGFMLPADVGKVYPRIPHFWSADHLYSVAGKLAPVTQESLKFSMEELDAHINSCGGGGVGVVDVGGAFPQLKAIRPAVKSAAAKPTETRHEKSAGHREGNVDHLEVRDLKARELEVRERQNHQLPVTLEDGDYVWPVKEDYTETTVDLIDLSEDSNLGEEGEKEDEKSARPQLEFSSSQLAAHWIRASHVSKNMS